MKHIRIISVLLLIAILSCTSKELTTKLQEGEALLNKKEAQLAYELYTSIIDQYPQVSEPYYGKSQAEFLSNNFNAALTSINRAIELDSSISDYYVHKGNILEKNLKPIMAVKEYKKAIEIDNNPFAYNCLGSVLMDSMRIEEALMMYSIAIKIQKDPVFYNNIAYSYEKLKQSDSAIANYNKAIELDPDNPVYFYSRAISKYRIGDAMGSLNDFTNAIKLDSLYHQSYYYRSLIYLEKGNMTLATQDLRKAAKLGNQFAKNKLIEIE